MRHVPPADRYDRHANSRDVPEALILKAIAKHGMDPGRAQITKLAGGFQNANYAVNDGSRAQVFRFYACEPEVSEREFGLLYFLQNQDVAAPRPSGLLEIDGKFVGVMQFIEGTPLQDLMIEPEKIPLTVFSDIGRALAKVHQISFAHAGFLGAGVSIDHEFDRFGVFAKTYIERMLKDIALDRLDAATRERLKKLIHDQWAIVLETEPLHHLVHCDFNPKNVMISKDTEPRIEAILDWEFALSGNGYMDMGNFFRFLFDYPAGAEAAFISGYESVRGSVHPRWRDIARLLDLTSVCSFLERKENYQKTFRTARWVIEGTLGHFGY